MQVATPKKGYKLVKTSFGKYEEIPEEWIKTTVSDLTEIPVSDGPHETPKFLPAGVPFLSVDNIVDSRLDFTKVRYISKEDHEQYSKKCKPVKNDILIGKAASVGKVAFVSEDLEFNIWSPIAVIRLKKDHYPLFFYYFFQSDFFQKEITKFGTNSTQVNIAMSDIKKLSCLTPTLPEQKQIASILSNVDDTIQKTDQIIEQTQRLKKGMMQKLLTRGIGHSKFKKVKWLFGKPIEIPEEWNIKKIKEITKKDKKITYGVLQPGNFDKNGIILIRGKDYIKGWAKEEEFFKIDPKIHQSYIRAKISSGDILMSITGAGIGSVNQVPEWIKEANITQNTARISCDEKIVYSNFILNYLKSDDVKRKVSSNSKTSAQPSISLEMIKNFSILVPSLPEQKQIATILSNIDTQIQKEKLHKSNLERLKKGLMQKLLTGQIRVMVS